MKQHGFNSWKWREKDNRFQQEMLDTNWWKKRHLGAIKRSDLTNGTV